MMYRLKEPYRPEGWENPHEHWIEIREGDVIHTARGIYEAGADAILEGLKNSGTCMKNFSPTNKTMPEIISFFDECENGWLAFITEEDNVTE